MNTGLLALGGVCVCVLLLKSDDPVGHCLETCRFPSDSAVCGQAR